MDKVAELAWPTWEPVNLLAKTHFNAMVRPRDETARVIAEALNAMPYAKPVRPRTRVKPPLTPQQVGARKVARLMRKMSKYWPDPETDAEILAAMRGEPPPSPSPPPKKRVLSPQKKKTSPRRRRLRIDLPQYQSPAATPNHTTERRSFPLYELVVADPLTYHALSSRRAALDDDDDGDSDLGAASPLASSSPNGARSPAAETTTPRSPFFRSQPSSPAESSTRSIAGAKSPERAARRKQSPAASPTRSKSPVRLSPTRSKSPERAAANRKSLSGSHGSDHRAQRFASFLAKQARVDREREAAEEEEDVDDPPIVESAEMILRRQALFDVDKENELGGLHSNQLTSVLAAPIDSTLAYCHPNVMQSDPNATVVHSPDKPASPVKTSGFAGNARRREAEWERVQGEDAQRRGDDAAASRHLRRAADLMRGGESDDAGAVQNLGLGEAIVYTNAAHLAAIRIQRNFRRHLRFVVRAVNVVKAHFRGHRQRWKDSAEKRREQGAARYLQRPARQWWRRKNAAILKLQRRYRMRMARRALEEKRFQKKLMNFLTSMGPVLRNWLRRRRKKKEDRTARFLQHMWRGFRIRGDYKEKVAQKEKRRFDASALLQGVLRRRWGQQHVDALRDKARDQEGLRAAAELYWVRAAARLSSVRSTIDREFWAVFRRSSLAAAVLRAFVALFSFAPRRTAEQRFHEAFAAYDVEGTRAVGYQEAFSLLRKFGVRCSRRSIPRLLVDLDPQRSGRIHVEALWQKVAANARCCCCSPRLWCLCSSRTKPPLDEETLRETRRSVRNMLAEFRAHHPPAFECAACRQAFPLFSSWWRHFDGEGHCTASSVPESVRQRYVARPSVDWRSSKSMALLEKHVQNRMTYFFDETLAIEHASRVAVEVAHVAPKVDSGARDESRRLAVAFRKRIRLLKQRYPPLKKNFFARQASRHRYELDAAELDLKNGLSTVDIRDRGYVNRDELSALFLVLANKWTGKTLPTPQSAVVRKATSRAIATTEAVFAFARDHDNRDDVVHWDTVVRWWSQIQQKTRKRIVPKRVYQWTTPFVLAQTLLVLRATAVAQRDALERFRDLRPLDDDDDDDEKMPGTSRRRLPDDMLRAAGLGYLATGQHRSRGRAIASRAEYTIETAAILLELEAHPPQRCFTVTYEAPGDTRIHPGAADVCSLSPASAPYDDGTPRAMDVCSLSPASAPFDGGRATPQAEVALPPSRQGRLLRRAWHRAALVGTPDTGNALCPTDQEELDAEKMAERICRARLRTVSGKLATTAERHHYDAMASFIVDESDVYVDATDQREEACSPMHDDVRVAQAGALQCALISLPYDSDGRGILHSRDVSDLVRKRLRSADGDKNLATVTDELRALIATRLVAFSELLRWCTEHKLTARETRISLAKVHRGCVREEGTARYNRLSSRQRAVDALVIRGRAIARGQLWSTVPLDVVESARDRAVVHRQQLLHMRAHWRSSANDCDVLCSLLTAAADKQTKRMLRSGRLFKNYLNWDVFVCTAMEKSFRTTISIQNKRDAALKQAEYWFMLYDVDSEGKVPSEVLGALLANFGVKLSSSEILVAATDIAGSESLVEWRMLHHWLSSSQLPQVLRRLDRGWITIGKRGLRRHAKLRLLLANRHRALAQRHLILAVEQKWESLATLAAIARNKVQSVPAELPNQAANDGSDVLSILEKRLQRAREMSAAHHRQRVGPFDAGILSEERSETEIATAMLSHADEAIARGLGASINFAQEYWSTRASLVKVGRVVQYDPSYSEAAVKADEVVAAAKKRRTSPVARLLDAASMFSETRHPKLPMAWTWWLGRATTGPGFS